MHLNNIYHCAVHKAASTFFREFFRNGILRRAVGYAVKHYETDLKNVIAEAYDRQTKIAQFPPKMLVTNIYCDYKTFANIKKYPEYRGFYIYRDPRELVVSSYSSWKFSHPGGHPNQGPLAGKNKTEGMIWCIDWLHDYLHCFSAMLTWVENCKDPKMRLYKFEDFFANDQAQTDNLRDLMKFLQIEINDKDFQTLDNAFSFKSLSQGRKRGEVKNSDHYRSGSADSFRQEISDEVLDHFYKKTGDIILKLGYEK